MVRKRRTPLSGEGEKAESSAAAGSAAGRPAEQRTTASPQVRQGGGDGGHQGGRGNPPSTHHQEYQGGGRGRAPQQYGSGLEYQGRVRGGVPAVAAAPYESGSGRQRGGPTSMGVGSGVVSSPGDSPIRPSSVPELHQANQGGVRLPPGQQLMQAPHQAGVTPQPVPLQPSFPSEASSSLPLGPSQVTQQLEKVSLGQEGAPGQAAQPPASSKALRFPARPGSGRTGIKCMVQANHFVAELPDKDLHHYDVSISPEVSSRGVNRVVMAQLVRLYQNTHLGSRLPAYDGRKSLYTAGPLPFVSQEFKITLVDDDEGTGAPRREREFRVAIKFAARADLHHLGLFLRGRQTDAPQEALQVLDIVLRECPTARYTPVGRSFYSTLLGRRQPLGDGLESWRGFYQSIRPTQMGLSLNIDMSSTAFIEPLPVLEFVARLLNCNVSHRPSDSDRVKIKKALRGIKVEVTHRGNMRRKYRIAGLTTQTTRELTFPVDDRGTLKYVVQYFQETYGFAIQHTQWPCLQVGNQQRPNYLPMEVCKIVEGQRYSKRLNDKQITALLKVTCQRPQEREKDILKKMVNGGVVRNWICINFARPVQENQAHSFCNELAQMCNVSGMTFIPKPVLPPFNARPDQVERVLKARFHDAMTELRPQGKELDLLIVILPDNNGSLYAEVYFDIQPLIRSVLDGFNVCIFEYGQTGSGKTYTMMGPNGATKENWGVNYRALNDFFQISV